MIVERIDPNRDQDDIEKALHIERYKFACKHVKGKAVLDIACGTGYGTYMLAKAGSQKVVGVDIDEETIKTARKQYKADNINFFIGDAQEIVLPAATFDIIVSFETLEHLEFHEKYLYAICEMLKNNGLYICSTPVREQGKIDDKPQNPFHFREWNITEFKTLLSTYFKIVEIMGQLYHFKRSLIPFNRTFANFLCGVFFKKEYYKMYKTNVNEFPNLPMWFGCQPSIQIALCVKS